ncbi:3'-to-5' exoribonuclease RNase R, partial [hydrothermal vent metagenome]
LKAMAQAAEIAASPVLAAEAEGRVDLRDLPLITVDGPSTRDFDDALHVRRLPDGNFEAGIHIADVAAFIKPGSALFAAACERTTSLYFPDGMVPMLPPVLSEGAFSLLAAEERPALSFMVTLDAGGRVLNKKIVRSMVRVRRQLSYQEAEDLLAVDQDLGDLVMLSRCLRDNRVEAGAMLIPVPDVVLKLADNEVKEVRLADVDSTMRLMVAEFMVLANSLAAGFLANRQEPGLYRSQGPPRKRFFKFPPRDDLFILFRQRRFLSRGNLGTVPKRHEGVGVEQYTTTTSPIRRLLDLIIQLQISAILAGKGALFTENDLKGYAGIMAGVQSKLNLVRQQRQRYWLLKYLESRKGERLAAFVLDRLHGKVQVVIQDFLLQTELPANQGVKHELGDVVMVKLTAVNPLNGTCRFEW